MATVVADIERLITFRRLCVMNRIEFVAMGVVSRAGYVLLQEPCELRILELDIRFLTINQGRHQEGKNDYRTLHLLVFLRKTKIIK